jgi:hypothetical protein
MKLDKDDKDWEQAFVKDENENEEDRDLVYNPEDLRKKFLDKYKKMKTSSMIDTTGHN